MNIAMLADVVGSVLKSSDVYGTNPKNNNQKKTFDFLSPQIMMLRWLSFFMTKHPSTGQLLKVLVDLTEFKGLGVDTKWLECGVGKRT